MTGKHVIFLVHGMGDIHPEHSFDKLVPRLKGAYCERHDSDEPEFDARFRIAPVHWHEVTEAAKTCVFDASFAPMEPRPDLDLASLLHPEESARSFMTYFLGDVVAYVSEYDNCIRREIWKNFQTALGEDTKEFSIVAHSLGSVIAFDFLFHLFEESKLFDPVPAIPPIEIERLKARFRNLFTMGSPIGLFMLRRGDLWRDDATRGAPFSNIRNPLPCSIRRWLNFSSEHDLFAYPLERLFARNPAYDRDRPLEDVKVATGLDPVRAHLGYWSNEVVAERIAEVLPAPWP